MELLIEKFNPRDITIFYRFQFNEPQLFTVTTKTIEAAFSPSLCDIRESLKTFPTHKAKKDFQLQYGIGTFSNEQSCCPIEHSDEILKVLDFVRDLVKIIIILKYSLCKCFRPFSPFLCFCGYKGKLQPLRLKQYETTKLLSFPINFLGRCLNWSRVDFLSKTDRLVNSIMYTLTILRIHMLSLPSKFRWIEQFHLYYVPVLPIISVLGRLKCDSYLLAKKECPNITSSESKEESLKIPRDSLVIYTCCHVHEKWVCLFWDDVAETAQMEVGYEWVKKDDFSNIFQEIAPLSDKLFDSVKSKEIFGKISLLLAFFSGNDHARLEAIDGLGEVNYFCELVNNTSNLRSNPNLVSCLIKFSSLFRSLSWMQQQHPGSPEHENKDLFQDLLEDIASDYKKFYMQNLWMKRLRGSDDNSSLVIQQEIRQLTQLPSGQASSLVSHDCSRSPYGSVATVVSPDLLESVLDRYYCLPPNALAKGLTLSDLTRYQGSISNELFGLLYGSSPGQPSKSPLAVFGELREAVILGECIFVHSMVNKAFHYSGIFESSADVETASSGLQPAVFSSSQKSSPSLLVHDLIGSNFRTIVQHPRERALILRRMAFRYGASVLPDKLLSDIACFVYTVRTITPRLAMPATSWIGCRVFFEKEVLQAVDGGLNDGDPCVLLLPPVFPAGDVETPLCKGIAFPVP